MTRPDDITILERQLRPEILKLMQPMDCRPDPWRGPRDYEDLSRYKCLRDRDIHDAGTRQWLIGLIGQILTDMVVDGLLEVDCDERSGDLKFNLCGLPQLWSIVTRGGSNE
jgi:hypothetical protein